MSDSFIDLRSDTVTRPSAAMRRAMAEAEVGDDMSGEDPTVNRLEAMLAEMFGKEAAVYACSGTQSNQLGIRAHCQLGDELLINETGHICNYEAGGPAVLSGVTCRTIVAPHGKLDVSDLEGKMRPDNQHLCRTRLVCIENTTNSGGGRSYSLEHIARVGAWARERGLKVHMDGARFFNAAVVRGYSPEQVGRHVDTFSLCFSKGLGCPMGSILVGSKEEIHQARRARKQFGGALRQAGIVAASAIYAIENNIERLADDHENARILAEAIAEIDGYSIDPADVETNLVFFDVDPQLGSPEQISAALRERGVLINSSGPRRLRACTHLDATREDVLAAAEALAEIAREGVAHQAPLAAGPYRAL